MSTTSKRDAMAAQHIRSADLEIARVLRRFGAVGGLIAARLALKQSLAVIMPDQETSPIEQEGTHHEMPNLPVHG